ncbi:LLM class flavin-dependent oxidoreductase [Pantoea sp. SM3]|uniref:LLM class flavin-dependent oxidoreductase n=1 Tax=Pantoea sp. SM3 TaxID=1628192 RepID=UPI001E42563D|nr:LLM class flavin-dependent oxidoreductase [Pantoea sp. SM3]
MLIDKGRIVMPSVNISHLSFLTPGNYADDAPQQGLEETLQLIVLGEQLGYNGAWVRQRHLEHGVSSASVFLAAATQRTRTIELGSAVIQMGYESPLRLAEDLMTVEVLSAGRLNVGLSAGTPNHVELIGDEVFHGDWQQQDFSYERLKRLQLNIRGRYFGDDETVILSPGNRQRPRVQPAAPQLAQRLWYGGNSHRSIQWAAENQFNLLIGNLTSAEVSLDYHEAQLALIRTFRQYWAADASIDRALQLAALSSLTRVPAHPPSSAIRILLPAAISAHWSHRGRSALFSRRILWAAVRKLSRS